VEDEELVLGMWSTELGLAGAGRDGLAMVAGGRGRPGQRRAGRCRGVHKARYRTGQWLDGGVVVGVAHGAGAGRKRRPLAADARPSRRW